MPSFPMIHLSPPNYPDVSTRHLREFAWPAGKACGVTIGWHVDGEAGPVFWERDKAPQHLAAISEAAYGVTTALPRILELHRHLEIPATFFVPAHVAERHPFAIEAILADGHEIGHHGYMHENVFGMSYADERTIFEHANEILLKMTGRKPRGWSAPGWAITEQTLRIMIDLGMLYDGSLMEYDHPHFVKTAAGELVELPISMVLDDWAMFGGGIFPYSAAQIMPADHARQIWQEEFDGLRHYGGLFHTTFHPNLTGRPGRLRMLAQLLEQMRARDDVWWGTCEQAAEWVLTLDKQERR